MFDPESVIKTFKPKFNLMHWLKGNNDMVVNKAQQASVLNDLKVYIFLFCVMVLALLLALTIMLVQKYKDRIQTKLRAIYKQSVWNGVIRSIDIGYIETVMTVGTQIRLWRMKSPYQQEMDIKLAVACGSFSCSLPIIYAVFLQWAGKRVTTKKFRAKYQNLYVDIHSFKNSWTRFYLPVSMVRRILFVLIPSLLHQYPFMQLQLLILLSICYIIWYAGVKPHIDKRRIRIEMFNEFMIIIFIYHLLLFTDFCLNNKMQFSMGYSFVSSMLLIVFANLALMVIQTVERSARKRKIDKLRLAQQIHMKAVQEAKDKEIRKNLIIRKRKAMIKGKLDLRSQWIVQKKAESAMMPSTQDKTALTIALYEQQRIIKAINEKHKNVIEEQAKKISKDGKINKKSDKKKVLETIDEESDNEDKLQRINEQIKTIQQRQDERKEENPELQKWKEVAEEFMEEELQQIREHYDAELTEPVDSPDRCQFTARKDDSISLMTPTKSALIAKDEETDDEVEEATNRPKPVWGLADEDVPDELKMWIAKPKKMKDFMDRRANRNFGPAHDDQK